MFTSGARLHFGGKDCALNSTNSRSALMQPNIVTIKLRDELSRGRIAGPYQSAPLPDFKSSPLALREKQESGKFRLLHNLSYPYDLQSVNHNIPKSAAHVKYETITDAITAIQQHSPDAYLAKSDIADAFRLIPLHPSQYHLTGFSWQNEYYYDRCLPQGSASSCKTFELFSTALKWILQRKLGVQSVIKVLDDFLFVANTQHECMTALHCFTRLCNELGVPIAHHKTDGPAQTLTFLGIQLNTRTMMAQLPADKLIKYKNDLQTAIDSEKLTQRELKSLIGKLQFATTVVKPGRPFLRRLYDLTMQVNKPHYYVRLTKSAKQDLDIWYHFLNAYNGKTMIRRLSRADSHTIHLYTDASKLAFGGTYGSHWVQEQWPVDWQKQDITVLELYPIYILVHMFKHKLRHSDITFHCDNSAIVSIINKQTSKHKIIMHIVRPLILVLLTHNITFRAEHIPGVKNTLCDAISRLQVSPTLLQRHSMKFQPTPIPDHLKPKNFKLR